MPSFIIKADPDLDLYCTWSTVVDNITWMGSRADAFQASYVEATEERLARADVAGTSVVLYGGEQGPPAYGWAYNGFIVSNLSAVVSGLPDDADPFYWLPRKNLAAYLLGINAGDPQAVLAALEIIPDED